MNITIIKKIILRQNKLKKIFSSKFIFKLIILLLIFINFNNSQNISTPKSIWKISAAVRDINNFAISLKLYKTTYRPDNEEIFVSENNLFKLHFDNSGNDSIAQVYTLNASTPDYIIRASQYLEASYFYLKDTLDFLTPPTDDLNDPQIDVYFLNLGNGNYGGTIPENEVTSTTRAYDYTAYTEIDNDMIGDLYYTQDTSALKVTCAHELFHVFQVGYNFFYTTDVWYLEASSVWFEDKMFPEVNDYIQYTDNFKDNWGGRIDQYGNPDFYQLCSWNIYLDEKYKENAFNPIMKIWENILEENAMAALTTFLTSNESNWENALSEWGVSHIYCGEEYFPDQSLFPDAEIIPSLKFSSHTNNYFYYNDDQPMNIQIVNGKYSNTFYKIADINIPQINIHFESDNSCQISAVLFDGNITNTYSISSNSINIPITSSSADLFLSIGSQDSVIGNLIIEKYFTELTSIYPNPVSLNQNITLEYFIQNSYNSGKINFFNILGQKTNSIQLNNTDLVEGKHKITISPQSISKSNTPSGIYFLQLEFPDKTFIKKFTFIK